jgi:hypothetical protein
MGGHKIGAQFPQEIPRESSCEPLSRPGQRRATDRSDVTDSIAAHRSWRYNEQIGGQNGLPPPHDHLHPRCD